MITQPVLSVEQILNVYPELSVYRLEIIRNILNKGKIYPPGLTGYEILRVLHKKYPIVAGKMVEEGILKVVNGVSLTGDEAIYAIDDEFYSNVVNNTHMPLRNSNDYKILDAMVKNFKLNPPPNNCEINTFLSLIPAEINNRQLKKFLTRHKNELCKLMGWGNIEYFRGGYDKPLRNETGRYIKPHILIS